MTTHTLRPALVPSTLAFALLITSSLAHATTILRDPMQGSGFVTVDGGLPLILGAPVGTPLEIDFVFTDLQFIELMDGASTTIEFGVGNTGNSADVDYRFVFDLGDENGNLITNGPLDKQGTAQAGFIQVENLDPTPLPSVDFHSIHILVETSFTGPNTGGGLFDLYVAGGAGDPGTFVSGPIRFNRAAVGKWIPEPSSLALGMLGIFGFSLLRRKRTQAVRGPISCQWNRSHTRQMRPTSLTDF